MTIQSDKNKETVETYKPLSLTKSVTTSVITGQAVAVVAAIVTENSGMLQWIIIAVIVGLVMTWIMLANEAENLRKYSISKQKPKVDKLTLLRDNPRIIIDDKVYDDKYDVVKVDGEAKRGILIKIDGTLVFKELYQIGIVEG